MSARRITEFRCDDCGATALSPDNYSLPEGWEYHNPAGEKGSHLCVNCVQRGAATPSGRAFDVPQSA
jgi:hypothetical protein